MRSINLAAAKAHLSTLVKQAAGGETVQILRRGKPVAQLTAIATPRKPIDIDALRSLVAGMPKRGQGAGKLVRAMRDAERY